MHQYKMSHFGLASTVYNVHTSSSLITVSHTRNSSSVILYLYPYLLLAPKTKRGMVFVEGLGGAAIPVPANFPSVYSLKP